MPISTSKEFIYFVIPKCGSATVRNSLDRHVEKKCLPGFFSEHFTIDRFLKSRYSSLMDTYFKFTFVRNPYDKIYSGFVQDKFAATHYPRWKEEKKDIFCEVGDDFNQYMQKHVATNDIMNDWSWVCFTPMHAFSHHNDCYQLDWFGRAENLEQDLRTLSSKLDLDVRDIESKNVRTPIAKGLKYLDRYERKTILLVNQLYKYDFEFFGYEMLNPDDFPEKVEVSMVDTPLNTSTDSFWRKIRRYMANRSGRELG